MGEFKRGTLKSSSGAKVTDRKQALAIAFSEKEKAEKQAAMLYRMAGIMVKRAQEIEQAAEEPVADGTVLKRKGPPPLAPITRAVPEASPNYSGSLVRQLQVDPVRAALLRAALLGGLGLSFGAGAGALASGGNAAATGLTALLGAGGLGAAGYFSGHGDAETENSRLLALRRFGLDTPAEQEFISRYPLPGASLVDDRRRL